MASRRRMHPVAEAALGIAAQVGQKAAKRALDGALRGAADSVLEDVGETGDRAKAVRETMRGEPVTAVPVDDDDEGGAMPRRRRAAEEEEEEDIDLEEEEDEEEDEEEEDEDEDEDEAREEHPRGKMSNEEFIEHLEDAETLVKNALYHLEDLVRQKSFPRKTFKLLERVHDEIEDRIDEVT